MITNLVAMLLVTFTTNVTERVSSHKEYPNPTLTIYVTDPNYWNTPHDVPDANPDFKWIKTEVVKETGIVWRTFDDTVFKTNLIEREIVKSTEVKLAAKREPAKWRAVETNDVTPMFFGSINMTMMTNSGIDFSTFK